VTALGERPGLFALLGCQNLFDLPPRLCHHRIQSGLHLSAQRANLPQLTVHARVHAGSLVGGKAQLARHPIPEHWLVGLIVADSTFLYVSRASIRVDPFYAVMRGAPVFDRLVPRRR